ncbi:MAG: TerB family tellurite resistance protein [Trueperaceae bacterium]|nr:TerB family tellurite resistance protein [Trueperaceae bacterium]
MLVWGTRAVKRTTDRGTFLCPTCGKDAPYERVRAQKHGHLYWIPLFATGDPVEYVECGTCRGTFDPAVLEHRQDREAFVALFEEAMLHVMAAIAVADGVVRDEERQVLAEIFAAIASHPLEPERLDAALRHADAVDGALLDRLGGFELLLNAQGKERILEAALAVAGADGDLDAREGEAIARIARVLDVSETHLKGLVAEMFGPSATDAS